MSELASKAAATAALHAMLPTGAPVVAMVSGGADSVSLLSVLASGALGDVRLSVLHVDHMLRGDASRGDGDFVAALCARLEVPCRVVAVDVAGYAEARGLNLEDAGRRVRYAEAEAELDARCDAAVVDRAAGRIATAHTFDDRAETLLMRLAQGTGARGLLGLPYRRGRIVRPLLDCTRAEVVAHLGELGQDWREDATNADVSRVRARVRAELVPLMRAINPRFDQALSRTLEVLGDEDETLDRVAVEAASACVHRGSAGPEELRIDRACAAQLPRAVLRRMLRRELFTAFPEASRLEFEHLEALCDGVADPTFARDLPDGLRAFSEYGTLVISRDAAAAGPLAPCLLDVPGTVDLGPAGVMMADPGGPRDATGDPASALIDADALTGPLLVTSPRPGDRMRPFGMKGTRKLQDVLTDAKVPARRRQLVPVVRDGDRIVWVAGVRAADEFRVGPATARTVLLTWIPRDAEGRGE